MLVFAGHGYGSGSGGLVCVRDGAPEPWAFPELVNAVGSAPEPALRLAAFIACRTFVAAPSLLTAGVPAVVAMQPLGQADFPERSVPVFAGKFFRELSHLNPVAAAHAATCRALAASEIPATALMPTLWLATPEDHLFASPEERLRTAYLEALLGKPEVALLPFPDMEGGVNFDELYVDQTVVEERREEQPMPSPEAAAPERVMGMAVVQEVVRRVEVDLWEVLEEHRRVMVEAPAWTGKSTLCRWVIQQCFEQAEWLPIFIRFRDFAQSGKSLRRYLEEDYAEPLGLAERRIEVTLPDGRQERISTGRWLYDLWQAGRALLIIDGADEEFDQSRRERALSSLPVARERTTRPYVLLTSRPLGDGGLLGFEKLSLNEFERWHIESLVRRCGEVLEEPEEAEQFIREMGRPGNGRALELAARPGHLVQMFATYVQDGVLLTAEEDLMNRVAYRRFAITGRVTPQLMPDEQVYKRQVAEEAAFHILFCRHGQPQNRAPMLNLVSQALMEVRVNGTPIYSPKDAHTMLEDLCRNSGFLQQTRKGAYEFESVPWLQFFAACYLARKLQEGDSNFKQWIFADADAADLSRINSALSIWEIWRRVRSYFGATPSQSAIRNSQSKIMCPLCSTPLPPFSHYLWRSEWHAVILLLAGVMADATPLLQRIEKEPDDIFNRMLTLLARALGRAARADNDVVQRTCSRLMAALRLEIVYPGTLDDAAFMGLGRTKRPGHVTPLLNALSAALHDKDRFVRRAAAWALGQLGDPSAVSALRAALQDKDEDVRRAAARALGQLGDPSAVSALRAALQDEDRFVRWAAAEALRAISEWEGVPILRTVGLKSKLTSWLLSKSRP
ncbi:MAG: HEAT repeat domain-containing protein [Anaerolineae bacterium]